MTSRIFKPFIFRNKFGGRSRNTLDNKRTSSELTKLFLVDMVFGRRNQGKATHWCDKIILSSPTNGWLGHIDFGSEYCSQSDS